MKYVTTRFILTALVLCLSLQTSLIAIEPLSEIKNSSPAQNRFDRFKAILSPLAIPAKDIKIMYTWCTKKVSRQEINPELQKKASEAFYRTGIPSIATAAGLMIIGGSLYKASKVIQDNLQKIAHAKLIGAAVGARNFKNLDAKQLIDTANLLEEHSFSDGTRGLPIHFALDYMSLDEKTIIHLIEKTDAKGFQHRNNKGEIPLLTIINSPNKKTPGKKNRLILKVLDKTPHNLIDDTIVDQAYQALNDHYPNIYKAILRKHESSLLQ